MNKKQTEHVIPLRREFVKTSRHKRAPRAIRTIKEYVMKHAKTSEVRLGKHLNEAIWGKGIKNPPGKVSVTLVQEDDYVSAELSGKTFEKTVVQLEASQEPEGGLKGKLKDAVDEVKGASKKDDDSKEQGASTEEDTEKSKSIADDSAATSKSIPKEKNSNAENNKAEKISDSKK